MVLEVVLQLLPLQLLLRQLLVAPVMDNIVRNQNDCLSTVDPLTSAYLRQDDMMLDAVRTQLAANLASSLQK